MNGTGLKHVSTRVNEIIKLPVKPSPSPPPSPLRVGPARAARKEVTATPPSTDLPIFLVFVGQSNLILQKQTIKKEKGGDFEDPDKFVARQFSLTLGSGFEELAAVVEKWGRA